MLFPLKLTFNTNFQKIHIGYISSLSVFIATVHVLDILVNLNTVIYTEELEIKSKRKIIFQNYYNDNLVNDITGIFLMLLSIYIKNGNASAIFITLYMLLKFY